MRERLSSRFGFLMLAAGCAVGLGNVWRFPYVVGRNGGAAFVLVYLAFLAVLGFPLLAAELAIGRASKRGIARALWKLSRRRAWRAAGGVIFVGNFVLMCYYTDVAGWLLKYSLDYAASGAPVAFGALTADRATCAAYMLATVAGATAVCRAGVVKGVERVTKFLMVSLLALLAVLAAKALTLPAAAAGVRFYLMPDWQRFMLHPWRGVLEAMGQAFFTLSLGIGCMTIFGSYMDKRRTLASEAAVIIAIDTLVALLAGLVIFPACMSYGVEPSSGVGLIFIALPEVFARMPGGRLWGCAFFLFLSFAAFTTIIAVFECLIGGICDEFARSRGRGERGTVSRGRVSIAVGLAVAAASLPCVLHERALAWEDFAVSQLWLPLGALAQALFVSWPAGWNWGAFLAEVNTGAGVRFPRFLRAHFAVAIPLLIIAVLLAGIFGSL